MRYMQEMPQVALRDRKVLQASPVIPAQQVQQAFKVRLVRRDQQVQRVPQAFGGLQVQPARMVLTARTELPVQQEFQEAQELRDRKASLVSLALLVQLV